MSNDVWTFLSRGDVVFWGAIVLLSLGPTLGMFWKSTREREAELQAIQNLADRGYSAEEIERLIRKPEDQ